MKKRYIAMATPLGFCALILGLGLVGISLLTGPAQSRSAQASSELIGCSSSSRQATIACCEERYAEQSARAAGSAQRYLRAGRDLQDFGFSADKGGVPAEVLDCATHEG